MGPTFLFLVVCLKNGQIRPSTMVVFISISIGATMGRKRFHGLMRRVSDKRSLLWVTHLFNVKKIRLDGLDAMIEYLIND